MCFRQCFVLSRSVDSVSSAAALFRCCCLPSLRSVSTIAAQACERRQLAVAELDARVTDHAGVAAEDRADGVLGGDGGVEAEGKVVAVAVAHLVSRRGLGQGKDAPVGHAADDALVLQDQVARGHDDFLDLGQVAGSYNSNQFV